MEDLSAISVFISRRLDSASAMVLQDGALRAKLTLATSNIATNVIMKRNFLIGTIPKVEGKVRS